MLRKGVRGFSTNWASTELKCDSTPYFTFHTEAKYFNVIGVHTAIEGTSLIRKLSREAGQPALRAREADTDFADRGEDPLVSLPQLLHAQGKRQGRRRLHRPLHDEAARVPLRRRRMLTSPSRKRPPERRPFWSFYSDSSRSSSSPLSPIACSSEPEIEDSLKMPSPHTCSNKNLRILEKKLKHSRESISNSKPKVQPFDAES